MLHLRRVVDRDVRVVRMEGSVILMVGLGYVKRFQRDDLRHDWGRKQFCLTLCSLWLMFWILRCKVQKLATEDAWVAQRTPQRKTAPSHCNIGVTTRRVDNSRYNE